MNKKELTERINKQLNDANRIFLNKDHNEKEVSNVSDLEDDIYGRYPQPKEEPVSVSKSEWDKKMDEGIDFLVKDVVDSVSVEEAADDWADLYNYEIRPCIRETFIRATNLQKEQNKELIGELLEALRMMYDTSNPTYVTPYKVSMGNNLGKFYVGGCGIPSDESIHKAKNVITKANNYLNK